MQLLAFLPLALAHPAMSVAPHLHDALADGHIATFTEREAHINEELVKREVGGVRMTTGVDFTGQEWYGVWDLYSCVALNDFAGNLLSFLPDEGTECLLMQGRCNPLTPYTSLSTDDLPDDTPNTNTSSPETDPDASTDADTDSAYPTPNDLSTLPYLADTNSYFCMPALPAETRARVKAAITQRLRVPGGAATAGEEDMPGGLPRDIWEKLIEISGVGF